MKITNKYNLPIELVNAIETEPHNKPNHYSATTLLQGTKELILTDNHYDEIEMDASECLNALLGTATHKLFETSKNCELPIEYKFSDNVILTGRIDYYNEETFELKDYKTTTTHKFIHKKFEDWKKQLMIYCWLLRKNNKHVKSCTIIGLCKDWSKSDYERYSNVNTYYPKTPIEQWTFEPNEGDYSDIDKFIREKITSIIANKDLHENQVHPCTKEERWYSGDIYACVKRKGGRATKLFSSKEEAEEYLINNPTLFIEERKGENRKCNGYCPVNKWCNFYKKLKEEELKI